MTEQERFDRCLAEVLRFEGGYSDNPLDAGGPTNLGVTLALLSQVLGRPADRAEVKALTPQSVAPIYRQHFWRAAGCDALGPGLDLLLFDSAVNMGPRTAVRLLQAALGLRENGELEAGTLAAAAGAARHALIVRLAELRGRRYRGLAGFPTFGDGWLARLKRAERLALDWAAEASPQEAA
jgi:lysozyme family protein